MVLTPYFCNRNKRNEMSKSKINVSIGVLTGVLAGFVLGAAFGIPDSSLKTDENKAAGNIANVSALRKSLIQSEKQVPEPENADTLNFTAYDEDGKEIEILIIKNK